MRDFKSYEDYTHRDTRMGWLRIVRPGSVIGPQQQYLVGREAVMRRTGAQYRSAGPIVAVRAGDGAGAAARLIAEAERIVDGRLRALKARSRRSLRVEVDAIGEQRTVASGRDAPRTRLSACSESSRGQESARGRAADSCRVGCKVALRYCADRLPPPAMREA